MKQIYIAGPMTGFPAYNYAEFMRVGDLAREHFSCQVYTPFNASNIVWMKHHRRNFDPYRDAAEYGSKIMREMFQLDLEYVCEADAIVLLAGWESSRGARLEAATAKLLGIPLFNTTFTPINPELSLEVSL